MSASVHPARWRPSDLWRTLAGLTVVLGTSALMLAGLDSVPAWITGAPRDVRLVANVAEAERRRTVEEHLALVGRTGAGKVVGSLSARIPLNGPDALASAQP